MSNEFRRSHQKIRAKGIISDWISRYGTLESITTDRREQFNCKLFNYLTRFLGANHIPK